MVTYRHLLRGYLLTRGAHGAIISVEVITMRTTTHHGRAKGNVGYSAKHNDRNFDLEKADNIDAELASQNIYVNCYIDETLTLDRKSVV